MVYHLENWAFMRDMMCSNPTFVSNDIVDILEKEMRIIVPLKHKAEIDRSIRDCGCVETQEGLEACLNISREDWTPRWFGKQGENPEFETLLQRLDERMKGYITEFFEKHII